MGIVHDFLGESHILLVGKMAAVDHYGRETVVDAVFAELECVTMVEVKHDLGMLPAEALGIFYCALGHVAEKDRVGIVAGTFRHLKDHRRFGVGSCLDDGLKLLHVVEVEGGDCISAVYCLCKHRASVYKA